MEKNTLKYVSVVEKNLKTQIEKTKNIEYKNDVRVSTSSYSSQITNEVRPFSVIGYDDRCNVNNMVTPYSAICFLEIHFSDGTAKTATGFMIGDNVCMTVAHAVKGASSIIVCPGKEGLTNPWGYTYATTITTPTAYDSDDTFKMNHDWAILRLQDEIGDQCGWLSIINYSAYINLTGEGIGCSGYPADKGYAIQYCAFDEVSYVLPQYFAHKVDIKSGQSGGPVFRESDCAVVGIQSTEKTNYNFACRINDENFNVALSIIEED